MYMSIFHIFDISFDHNSFLYLILAKTEAGETPDCRFAWSTVNALPLFISSLFNYVLGFIYFVAIVFVRIHIYVYLSLWQRSTKIYNLEFHQVLYKDCSIFSMLSKFPPHFSLQSIIYTKLFQWSATFSLKFSWLEQYRAG